MGQYREITREVSMPNATPVRTWDAPTGAPIKNMTIVISSNGAPVTAASVNREVLYGGVWDGTPFDSDSTHSGGVRQVDGALAAATEVAHIIYEDSSILPTNAVGPTVQHDMKKYGMPVVLELTNNTGAALTLYVTFISETIHHNV
jgi:hypothetical protein